VPFDAAADAYNRYRLSPPDEVIDAIVEASNLRSGSRVLEIGCGTGQLSVPLAQRGVELTAVERGPQLAERARSNLATLPNAHVDVSAFEEWPLPRDAFDAVVCANAFHWLDPEIRISKSFAALRTGGVLTILHTHHVRGGTPGFFAATQPLYVNAGLSDGTFTLPAPDEIAPSYPELASAQRRRFEIPAEIDPAWWWTPGEVDVASLVAIDTMEVFRYGEDDMFAIADALGARSINAADVLGGAWTIDDAAEAFAGLCERAAEHGLLVHLEFLPWSRIPDLATAWEVVRKADRVNGGVAIDAWHWFRSGASSDLTTLRAIPGDKVLGIQLDDAPRDPEANLMSATLHQRLLPGEGVIDLAALLGALHEIGAVAPIGVEVFSDELHELGPIEAAKRAADATRAVLAQVS
jgi:sugar phosphate isomerase/epimerase